MARQRMKVAGNDCTLYKQIYLIFGVLWREWLASPDSTLLFWVSLFQAFSRLLGRNICISKKLFALFFYRRLDQWAGKNINYWNVPVQWLVEASSFPLSRLNKFCFSEQIKSEVGNQNSNYKGLTSQTAKKTNR